MTIINACWPSIVRVFENRVLSKIFGPKRDEVTGHWWKLHREELHDPYSSPNIMRMMNSRKMKWAGHVARVAERGCASRVLLGKPERNIPI
jgi:hypothetical protein